jgi:hypothetical protein
MFKNINLQPQLRHDVNKLYKLEPFGAIQFSSRAQVTHAFIIISVIKLFSK